MSLRFKLLSLISICAVAFIVFSSVSWSTMNTVKVSGDWYSRITMEKDLVADILPPPEYILEAYLFVYQMLEETDSSTLNEMILKSKSLREEYDHQHEYWAKSLPDGRMKDELVVQSYQPALEFFNIRDTEFIPSISKNDKEKAREILHRSLKPKYEAHRKAIDNVVKMANERLREDELAVKDIISNKAILLLVLGLGIFGLIFICGLYMNYICSGIIGGIARVVNGLSNGSEQISSAAAHLTTASQDLAEGSSEQATSLEETSSSLDEMSSMTKQNAGNAIEANTLMVGTSQVVMEAATSMTELTSSMQEISRASEETSKIIKTIDEIAFQTNLLALNAAVEAARAGEAGAGFAVVADEVRNLAMRAADAARNTADLIEGTVNKIKNGSELVMKTSSAFARVAEGSQKIGGLIDEINAASQEQAQGIDQINKAVAEMEKVTQQNAANAEESASAAEELISQAEQMKSFVENLIDLVGGNRNDLGKAQKKTARKQKHTYIVSRRSNSESARKALPASGKAKERNSRMRLARSGVKELPSN